MASRVDGKSFGRDDDQVWLEEYHARTSFVAIYHQGLPYLRPSHLGTEDIRALDLVIAV